MKSLLTIALLLFVVAWSAGHFTPVDAKGTPGFSDAQKKCVKKSKCE